MEKDWTFSPEINNKTSMAPTYFSINIILQIPSNIEKQEKAKKNIKIRNNKPVLFAYYIIMNTEKEKYTYLLIIL